MPFCPYCGKEVKDNDKFCLFCGEPLLKTSSKKKSGQDDVKQDSLLDNLKVGEGTDAKPLFPQVMTPPAELDKIPLKEEKTSKDQGKGKAKDKSKDLDGDKNKKVAPFSEDITSADLDPVIREDLQARIDFYHLSKKIKKVQQRINESIKIMEDENFRKKYEFDDEFRKTHQARFEALKQIGEVLKKQKNELISKIQEKSPLETRYKEIKKLKQRLIDLNNSFLFKKIERKAYDKLHAEYKKKLEKLLDQRRIDNYHLSMWVSDLKSEQNDLRDEIELLKGRKASKELSKSEFKEQKEKLEKKIKKLDEDIEIIQKFMFED
ncbi:MAG: zinc-ribbon domain-containing protein [Promethearchaeota archaeon]